MQAFFANHTVKSVYLHESRQAWRVSQCSQ